VSVCAGACLLTSASFVLLRALLPIFPNAAALFMYMWAEISVQLLTQQFWDLCSDSFGVSQSKKYFGFINSGSTLATCFVGFVLIRLLSRLRVSTADNMLILAAVIGLEVGAAFSVG
jgi:ATP/ADP translocase